MRSGIFFVFLILAELSAGKIFFKEEFGEDWETRWKKSDWKKANQGDFNRTQGKWYGDKEMAWGIQTSQGGNFFEISCPFPSPIKSRPGAFILQYSIKFEQVISCGGGYIKLLPTNYDAAFFGGQTHMLLMFGPDICGFENSIQFILDYEGIGYKWKKQPPAPNDELTHIYTAVLYDNNSYAVYLDAEPLENGTFSEDWELEQPQTIPDPFDTKPEDWDERKYISNVADKKPADWEDEEMIPDEGEEKPEDWDEEKEGKWKIPMILNPNYKGEWKPKKIYNVNYKGVWKPRMIPNPNYRELAFPSYEFGGLGIDVLNIPSGSIFDNMLITDSLEEALTIAREILVKQVEKEKENKNIEEAEEAKRHEERKKQMMELEMIQEGDSTYEIGEKRDLQ